MPSTTTTRERASRSKTAGRKRRPSLKTVKAWLRDLEEDADKSITGKRKVTPAMLSYADELLSLLEFHQGRRQQDTSEDRERLIKLRAQLEEKAPEVKVPKAPKATANEPSLNGHDPDRKAAIMKALGSTRSRRVKLAEEMQSIDAREEKLYADLGRQVAAEALESA